MGYYTDKAKEVKAKQESETQELLALIGEAVEAEYNKSMEVINNA